MQVPQASGYFESDILATHEYYQSMKRRDYFRPEEKLLFAILTDAIECFQRYCGAQSRRHRKLFQQAETWIFGQENDALCSFESICDSLHISPEYLRSGLCRWRDEHESASAPQKRLREPLRYTYRIRSQRISI